MPEISGPQMARMFNIFKSVFLAGGIEGDGKVIDVESALNKLERSVLEISDGVQVGMKKTPASVQSVCNADDFTTPGRKGKKVVKRDMTPQIHSEEKPGAVDQASPALITPVPTCTPRSVHESGSIPLFTVGRSHKGSSTKSYSMYERFLAMEDWFHGMSQESVCEKYAITSSRSLRRWLKEWGQGMYDECMEWSVAELKKKEKNGRCWPPP